MSKEEKRIAREKAIDEALAIASDFLSSAAALFLILAAALLGLGVIAGTVASCLEALGVTQVGWFWATFAFWAPWSVSLAFALSFSMASFGIDCIA